ncbi:lactate utilization protein [Allofournierella sp.]|uniref:lactate utilization protein n=1 Tax=Allofournierella sp. TaxID=1940256 RepID=UPI003AB8EBBE
MQPKEIEIPEKVRQVLHNLQRNNMEAAYVDRKEGAAPAVQALLRPGDRIAVGGSATLEQTGVLELVQSPEYRFIDRYEENLGEAQRKERLRAAFEADVLLCSANAILESGELYQVDGLSNRIAPLVYGPDRVIVVAGVNKIVEDLAQAAHRVRAVTAPAIVKKWGLDAPCIHAGGCVAEGGELGRGCMCDARRCCNFLVMGRQRVKGRIRVILVGEALGF